ncbi:MAG: nucleoside triphosphate pyrophosphohydrolase [Desulfovibrionales bacterium]|nr:nucleoside triphosphate pyrophosphohydrolase [Desulfovibrionales bacterium]
MKPKATEALIALRNVIDELIGENGCPWDKEQTPQSLCDYLLEETYELVDAIRTDSPVDVREEMGDVLFLLLFISTLYEKNNFTIADSMQEGAAKMIRRHPHVFGELDIKNVEEVWSNWEKIKRGEKKEGAEDKPKNTFDSLPSGLPSLLKAYRLNSKAARVGFTWHTDDAVEEQYQAEWKEFTDAVATEDADAMEAEFGDVLFTLVELGRRHGIKANAALDRTNLKFLDRFEKMEALARERNLVFADLSFEEKDALWNDVKAQHEQ